MKKPLLFLFLLVSGHAYSQQQIATWKRLSPTDSDKKSYTNLTNSTLLGYDGSGVATLYLQSGFQSTLVSGTSIKTINGITLLGSGDLVTVVDAINNGFTTSSPSQNAVFDALVLKANASHTHVSADITDASEGGNGSADAGLLVKFLSSGGIRVAVDASGRGIWASGTSGAYGGLLTSDSGTGLQATSSSGDGVVGSSSSGHGGLFSNTSSSVPPLYARSFDATLAAPLLELRNFSNTGATFNADGSISWSSATGASQTKTNLGLGSVENTALSTWTGSTNLTTLGTVGTGTWAGTPIAITSGGTAATSATSARTNLGVRIGADVQAYDGDLDTWSGITPASGIGTFLATPSSANLAAAITNETGSGALVFATSPTFTTPALGTPSSGTLTNCTFPTLNQNTTGSAATLTTGRTIGMTGDVTWTSASFNGSGNVTGTATLANSGVTAGTYNVPTITVDAKGRVTSAASLNTGAVLGSDFTTSSATAVDITGYSVTLSDPGTYNVIINAFYTSPNSATGVGVTMTITGSPSLRSFGRKEFTAATTTIDDMINTDDAGTVPTTVGGTNVPRHVLIAGTVKTNGSNCTIQMRAVRGGTSNTITILAGSNMTAQKIQ